MKRTIILIDGQNLFYSLKNMKIWESEIEWTKFFNSLLDKDDELLRTYWYRPAKILDRGFTYNRFYGSYIWKNHNDLHAAYYEDYRSLPSSIKIEAEGHSKECLKWIDEQKAMFTRTELNYDTLSLKHDNIEIVKTGIVKIDPVKRIWLGEKGVDVALAVRMIEFTVQKKCDKIIFISGDYDYLPAIQFAKNEMMRVHVVMFHKGYPPKNRSMSKDISMIADKVINVYESELRKKYFTKRENK